MAKIKEWLNGDAFASKVNAERAVRAEIAKHWSEDTASSCAVKIVTGAKSEDEALRMIESIDSISSAQAMGVIVGFKDKNGGNTFFAKVFIPESNPSKIAEAALKRKSS